MSGGSEDESNEAMTDEHSCSDKAPKNLCMEWDCSEDWVAAKCPQTCHNCSSTIADFSVRSDSTSQTSNRCRLPKSFGDGYCDDDNNVLACSWDNVKTNYCQESMCREGVNKFM